MTTSLYRLSSNEDLKISVNDQTFSDRDPAVFAVLVDPTTPDGTDVRDTSTDPSGPLRVLGFAKIAEPGGNNVRNATQPEIDTFAPAELDDDNQLDAVQADYLWANHPQWRKLFIAYLRLIGQENNILRAEINQLRSDTAASVTYNDFRTNITNRPNLDPRTSADYLARVRLGQPTGIDKDD